uniref:3'-5' exonuclease domain-containing protein n=1 Tax=Strongyloides stercoralis TaxID=6248 RepID=A0AAF5I348_STRER
VMVLNLTNDLLILNKLSNSSSHSYIRNVANIYKRYLSITDIKIIKILNIRPCLRKLYQLWLLNQRRIMIFFDVTILKFIILLVFIFKKGKKYINFLAFRKQIFELRIIEKFINNIVKRFYVSNEVVDVFQKFIETFYDIKYESVTFNYKMNFNYLIETNKIKNIFKEAMIWLYDAKLIAVDIEFLPDIVSVALSENVLIFNAKKISVKQDCWKKLINFFFNSTYPILFFDYKNDYKLFKKIIFAKLEDVNKDVLLNKASMVNGIWFFKKCKHYNFISWEVKDKILFIFDELKVRFDEKHIPKNVLIVKEINKENLQKDLFAENEISFYNVDKKMCYSNGFVINMVGGKLYHNKNKMFFSKFTLLKITLCFVVIVAHSPTYHKIKSCYFFNIFILTIKLVQNKYELINMINNYLLS